MPSSTPTTDPAAPWWAAETPIPLAAVPDHLPRRGTGRTVSVATVYRWTVAGVRGMRLRRYRAGPVGWCTTAEELVRWARWQTQIAGGDL